MENHYYDADGVYVRSAPANPGSLCPVNALRTQPPRSDGFWPVLSPDGKDWDLTPDHRGRQGWLHGRPTVIKRPGPLPEGWTDTVPEPEDGRDAKSRKREDFAAETDPLLLEILAYQAEAEAAVMDGDTETQKTAENKKSLLLRQYRVKKNEIRNRYSSTDRLAAFPTTAATEPRPPDEASDKRVYLTSSGSYHIEGCRYTTAAGKWLSVKEALVSGRKLKPCSRCRPGRLEE